VAVIISIFGLLIGSFLNVCIYRIPKNLSIVYPNSHCPKCKKEIKWYDNVPVLSYMILGGRCRHCKAKITPRYLIVEVLTSLLFLLAYLKFGYSTELLSTVILFSFLVIIALIDLKTQYIYDVTVVPLAVLGLIFSFFIKGQTPLLSLVGFLTGGAIFLSIAYISRLVYKQEGMGMGDVKLAAAIGAFLGWRSTVMMVIFAVVFGGIISIILLLIKKKGRRDYIPFGPFLVLGTVLMVLTGDKLSGFFNPGWNN
jgi:leader peptidase (prepilin peptidase)/N-methyltransferase